MLEQIIVLDDEVGFQFLFEHHLKEVIESGVSYKFTSDSDEAVKFLENRPKSSVLICDVCLKEQSGLKFAQDMAQRFEALEIVLISGKKIDSNGFKFFSKPMDFVALRSYIQDLQEPSQSR